MKGIEQRAFRIPHTGEGWRHCDGGPESLVTIIGMAYDASDLFPMVVYTPANWSLVELPPIFVMQLDEFVMMTESGGTVFCFEREVGHDIGCPFIREADISSLGRAN